MDSSVQPRVVLVTRTSEYEALLARHGTREQARFFLETRGQSIDDVEARHRLLETAVQTASSAIPAAWRRSRALRDDLDRFLFEPDDLIVAVGQDGLVANVAKYLDGQPVIGLNPDRSTNEGVLVPHPPEAAGDLYALVARGDAAFEERTMVGATRDDGEELVALNELFIGHRSHQSARYRIACAGREERA